MRAKALVERVARVAVRAGQALLRPVPETDRIATRKKLNPAAMYLTRFENPEKMIERGEYPYAIYDKVYRDPQVRACMQTRKLALMSKEYEVAPAIEDDSESERVAVFVRDALSWISGWNQARSELLDAIHNGFGASEILWVVENGQIWIDTLKAIEPRYFAFDQENRLKLVPSGEYEGAYLPERKFAVVVYDPRHDNPYGNGLAGVLYWPTWFKSNVIRFALQFCEKYASPTPLVKYKSGASDEQQTKALELIDTIQNEGGAAIPDWMEVELLEAQRSGSINVYDYLTTLCDAQIAKVILGQTLTTEQGDTGSYALGQVHNDVRQDILEADGQWLDDIINKTLVRWLVDFNFGVDVPAPVYRTKTEPAEDLKGRIEVDAVLAKIVPLPTKDVYERYGWRQPEKGEDVTSTHQQQAPAMPPALMAGGVASFSEPARFDRILDLEDSTLRRAPGVYRQAITAVKKKSLARRTGPRFASSSASWRVHQ